MHRRQVVSLIGATFIGGCGFKGARSDASEDFKESQTSTMTSTPLPDPPKDTETETNTATPTTTTTGKTTGTTTTPIRPEYERTDVVARTKSGQQLGLVTAAIADTPRRRSRGLSDTPSLPEDQGMLFVLPEVGDYTFVMLDMDFGIDIIYADNNGTITRIHHAEEPAPDENGVNQPYPGTGQYVLEVVLDWTTERGVGTGDVLDFELS